MNLDADPCPSHDQLKAFAQGRLEEEQVDAISSHLEHCAICSEKAEAVQSDSFMDALHKLNPENRTPLPSARQLASLQGQGHSFLTQPFVPSPLKASDQEEAFPNIPGYTILQKLEEGGMGIIYLAWETALERQVVLKMIKPRMLVTDQAKPRFQKEAQSLSRLQHPNIVTIHRIGDFQGQPFFVMEYIQGGNLKHKWRNQPQPPREVARFVEIFSRAVHYAHEQGVVHRDLKPNNILLTPEGLPKVTDFGLAKHLSLDPVLLQSMQQAHQSSLRNPVLAQQSSAGLPKPEREASSGTSQPPLIELTQHGQLLGTPAYMAPEQVYGDPKQIGRPADIYGLGAILYEGLVGTPPFMGPSTEAVLKNICSEPVVPPRKSQRVPRDLNEICLKCLHKDPTQRYATAEDLANDLARFGWGLPVSVRSVGWVEQLWKGMCRQPKTAAAVIFALVILVVGIVSTSIFGYQATKNAHEASEEKKRAQKSAFKAEKSALIAKEKQEEAEKQRGLARESAKKAIKAKTKSDDLLYTARVPHVYDSWKRNQLKVALMQLDQLRPLPNSKLDRRGWEWYFLMRLCHSDLFTMMGHTSRVRSVACNPDGKVLASAGDDQTIRLWDAKTGRNLKVYRGHQGKIVRVAFSPDGKQIASASEDGTVILRESDTGKELSNWSNHILPIHDVAFSPDGRKLASTGEDTTILVWDVENTGPKMILQGHSKAVFRIAFHPNEPLLASSSEDRTIRLWDLKSGKEIKILGSHSGSVRAIAFSPDGQYLASGGSDARVRFWEVATGKKLWENQEHQFGINDIVFSPDGQSLVTASTDTTVRVWEANQGQLLNTIRGHLGQVYQVQFHPDGKRLVSASADFSVRMWKPREPQKAVSISDHVLRVTGVAFSADSKRIATSSFDQSVKLWDGDTGKLLLTLGKHTIERAPGKDGKPGPIRSIGTYFGHGQMATSVALSSDGLHIASAGFDNRALLWSAETGKLIRELRHGGPVTCVAFSPDDKYVATGSWDDSVCLWEVASGKRVHLLEGHSRNVSSLAFSPDGKQLVSGSWDGTLKIWDTHKGTLVRTLKGLPHQVECVAWSPDGKWIASGGNDRLVHLWDADLGKERQRFVGHLTSVKGVAFSPDGMRLASTGVSQHLERVKLWDVATGQELLSLQGGGECVAFSPDGKLLASGGSNRKVILWNSQPVGENPGRLAPLKELQEKVPSSKDTGIVKILGYALVGRLHGGLGFAQNTVLQPGVNREFLVVVVSLPRKAFQLSEETYQEYKRKKGNDPDGPPLPARGCLSEFRFKRFGLLQGTSPRPAELLGNWPDCMGARGFCAGSFTGTSSDPHDPEERIALALAWRVPKGAAKAPFSLQVDDREPVIVPDLLLHSSGGVSEGNDSPPIPTPGRR